MARKKCQRQLVKVIRTEKAALGREDLVFFSWAPLGLSAPGGEKPMERVCFLVASRPGLHRQLVKSGLCDGALGLVVTYLKPRKRYG